MELYKEILAKLLEKEEMIIVFPGLTATPAELIEIESYKALQEIKAILEEDSLEDRECFMKIEDIVCVFEGIGSDGGHRHDFG